MCVVRRVPEFTPYLQYSRYQLVERLAEVHKELADLYQERAIVATETIKARVEALKYSSEKSATARAQEAEIASGTAAATGLELQADHDTLLEEKFFILRLLDAFHYDTNSDLS